MNVVVLSREYKDSTGISALKTWLRKIKPQQASTAVISCKR